MSIQVTLEFPTLSDLGDMINDLKDAEKVLTEGQGEDSVEALHHMIEGLNDAWRDHINSLNSDSSEDYPLLYAVSIFCLGEMGTPVAASRPMVVCQDASGKLLSATSPVRYVYGKSDSVKKLLGSYVDNIVTVVNDDVSKNLLTLPVYNYAEGATLQFEMAQESRAVVAVPDTSLVVT